MQLLSYLLNMFAGLFWIFRVYMMVQHTYNRPFILQPVDPKLEIVILFLTVFCIYMLFRRNLIFAAAYFSIYLAYFGYGATQLLALETMTPDQSFNLFINILAVLLALLNFLDVLFNKNRIGSTKDNKTDWFYATHEYERQLDDRADKNQYKIR